MKSELPIPNTATADPKSIEMVRAWVAAGGLHCSLNIGAFGENEVVAWGILLSDIARHVANAMRDSKGTAPEETLEIIRDHFNTELDSPTESPEGSFIQ
jgi:hypothetical protein